MSEIIATLKKLHQFIDVQLTWEQLEQLYEEVQRKASSPEDEEKVLAAKQRLINLPIIQAALENQHVTSTLLDICSGIRALRSDVSGSYDNTYDCWDQLSKVINAKCFLALIYSLAGLVHIDSTSSAYINLSVTAIDTYILCLTIPGAKGFHIFQEDIIKHCLQVFNFIERLYNINLLESMAQQQVVRVWIQFSTLCDDIKLLLRYVHFKSYLDCRDEMLRKLINIQYLNFEKGYINSYAKNLHQKVFEILEEMINAHNGDPEQTLLKLMNMTVTLHTYGKKPKNQLVSSRANLNMDTNNYCEHIADWFIKIIDKYPRILVKVLSFYIECVITNPIKGWKNEQLQKALDYAALYDGHLFTKCNASCVELLCDAVFSDEVMTRSRAVDLMSRILQTESQVDWKMFRHEVSNIPREVYLIKELIISLQDSNNNIKLKAMQALQASLSKGSPKTIHILKECIKFVNFPINDNSPSNIHLPEEPRLSKNEIRYKRPTIQTADYTFQGHEILQPYFSNLPKYIFQHFYQNPILHVRRAGITFMEELIKLNPLFIFNTNFVAESIKLVDEPVALVRKQTLLSLDNILEIYPNCYPVIWAWCKIIAPMLHDADPKNIEIAMECFRSRVLLNIRSIEESNKAEHFMPWVIVRTMLRTQSRLYLQNCFHTNLRQQNVNTKIVSLIESHLITSNSTEAWILLNFLSGKLKSREPDALIHQFISLDSWNAEQNMLIALEVLRYYVQDFSHMALNQAFNHILIHIKDGNIVPIIVGKAIDFLLLIDRQSQTTEESSCQKKTKGGEGGDSIELAERIWIKELHELLEKKIIENIDEFPYNHVTFMSHLYAYTEVNLHTRLRPHQTIILFMHKYLMEYTNFNENGYNYENERLFNSVILLTGRLSLRDVCVARKSCNLFAHILKIMDRPPLVNTILIVMTDLCKKHTHIVENVTSRILDKLKSPFEVNRLETFKYFEQLILEDQLKLRGSLLLSLLATLLDASQELSHRAEAFFIEYTAKKNPALFQKCLLECPFILNEYKNFDGLDNFAGTYIKSPLKGQIHEKRRYRLYEYFLKNMSEITMLLYFEQLKLLSEKSSSDPSLKLKDGVAVVKDVFHILKRICQLTKEKKSSVQGEQMRDDENFIDFNEANPHCNAATTITQPMGAADSLKNSQNQRGRRKREVTVIEATSLVEKMLVLIPTIHRNLTSESKPEYEKIFDDLCVALNKRFPNLIEYAQPLEFWKKYKQQHDKEKAASKSKKCLKDKSGKEHDENNTNNTDNVSTNDDDYYDLSNSDSDSDINYQTLGTKRFCLSPKADGVTSTIISDKLSIEYVFRPNI